MSRLVHRLERRSRRPGVSWPQQGRNIADRHLSMVRRSALVERLGGRGRSEGDVDVPVVYAQLEMPSIAESATSSSSGPLDTGAGVTIVNVAGRTVNVVGRTSAPVIQAKTIRDLAPTAPTQPTVVQALASTASTRAADASPSSEAVTSRQPTDVVAPIRAGILTTAGRHPTQNTEWRRTRPETGATEVVPSTALVVTPQLVAPAAGAETARRGWVAPDGATQAPSTHLPVVVEHQRTASPPEPAVRSRLPLVAPLVGGDAHRHPTSQPVDRPEPHGGAVAPAHYSPTPVLRIGPQDRVAERPAIDIDRLADTVHARLLRRLAIERERRGVMR